MTMPTDDTSGDTRRPPDGGGHSRRAFLKGVGLVAGASLVPAAAAETTEPGADAPAPIAGVRILGAHARPVTLKVNGAVREVVVEPRTTLLSALREQLGVTGPKEACGRGACGACTVMLGDRTVASCMTLAIDAAAEPVTTVEGIAADPQHTKLIDAFCEHDAAQCGFCIPGFVVRSAAILRRDPGASRDAIKAGLAGNLCRCGTYPKIFAAVAAAAGHAVAPLGLEKTPALENDRPRVDVRAKVTGAARYAADQYPKDVLHAAFVRFPYGVGKLTAAQKAAALAVPGVVELELELHKRAPYVGARLGHIVARSRDALEDGLERLELSVSQEPARTDPERLLRLPRDLGPPAAVTAAAAKIVSARYTTQVQTHSSLETHTAVVDHHGDRADAWMSTQGVMSSRSGLARHVALDPSRITVHAEYVGGGFGSKFGAGAEGALAAKVTLKHGKPCRVHLTRREEHLDTGNRPGSIQMMSVGADASGKLVGGRIHVVGVVGHSKGGGGVRNPLVYDFGPVTRTEDEIMLSTGRPRAFRAPGRPQGVFAVESMIGELAAALGKDPVEMRLLNETSDRRRKQLRRAAKLIGWERRQADGAGKGPLKRGLGCGAAHWHSWPTECEAELEVFRTGKVEARAGVQDIGTGTFTVVADVTAHALGIDRDMVTARVGRSTYPPGPASGGSVTAPALVPALRDAAEKLVARLVEDVARAWGVRPARVRFDKGMFREPGSARAVTWEGACGLMGAESRTARGEVRKRHLGEGDTSAVQMAEVEVDIETGVVRVLKIVAVQACGQVVNRLTAENQVAGGVIQGLSYALFEEQILDRPTGGVLNANLEQYKIAGALDIPEIQVVLDVEPGDTGVRSLGEPPIIPTAGAIANAVANATGARVRSLPITPARVLAALKRGTP